MMMTKQIFVAAVGFVLATSALAGNFKGNWTETFQLKDGHYAVHTPEYVSLDGVFTAGTELDIDGTTINGTTIQRLDIKVDSSREEFVAALKRSNLY